MSKGKKYSPKAKTEIEQEEVEVEVAREETAKFKERLTKEAIPYVLIATVILLSLLYAFSMAIKSLDNSAPITTETEKRAEDFLLKEVEDVPPIEVKMVEDVPPIEVEDVPPIEVEDVPPIEGLKVLQVYVPAVGWSTPSEGKSLDCDEVSGTLIDNDKAKFVRGVDCRFIR